MIHTCLVFRRGLRVDDSYSVRIQALTPIVFKDPKNFDLASSWYQIYWTILCSLPSHFVLIQHLVTFS